MRRRAELPSLPIRVVERSKGSVAIHEIFYS